MKQQLSEKNEYKVWVQTRTFQLGILHKNLYEKIGMWLRKRSREERSLEEIRLENASDVDWTKKYLVN